jgi:hypothetical protein
MFKFTSCLVAAALLAGCGASPLQTESLGSSNVAYFTAAGGVVLQNKNGAMCVMPPAEAALTVSAKVDASANTTTAGGTTVDPSLSADFAQSINKLYDQSQGNLYLQFTLYRACEWALNMMAENKPVDAAQYANLLTLLADKAATILDKEVQKSTAVAAAAAKNADAAASKAQEATANTATAKANAAAEKLKATTEILKAKPTKVQLNQLLDMLAPEDDTSATPAPQTPAPSQKVQPSVAPAPERRN